ncbi:MAG TPA: hybrid sensor histidine kinase/response regulator [Rhodoblastus sp.]|nr:hybrid sensor histidine kinase/response regulator [Rhodoblastus sp.]
MLKAADDGLIAAEIMGRTVRAAPLEIVQRLTKINAALVERLENRIDQQASAYSLFQTAIGLEAQVRERTAELKRALLELERSNVALVSAKEAAEKENSSKTRFLAAAGHDLLQPLYAAQLSMSTLVDLQADPAAAKLCRQVDRALVTIEAYLRSILDISKLDAGVVTPEFQPVRLSEMFHSLDSDFRPIVERKQLKLRFRPTDMAVVSDPILLRRILQNLVSNATRYTSEGGVFIGARRRGDCVRIEVTDTGVGVAPADIERIFEEFHRAHSSDAPQSGEGLGLGLSIVRRMSQALDHRVEVRSNPARGSRFTVIAPLAEPDLPRAADFVFVENWARANDLRGRSILLVENDPEVMEATRWLLAQWGADVVLAPDLDTVRARLAGGAAPDAIVADYHLDRDESGLQAITLARRITQREIPSVIVTADQGVEAIEQARAAGCELMRKPVKPAQLRAVLTHLL